jgi:hypothetical protein
MREVIFKIIFDGVVDDYVRKQIDECDFKDVFSGSDSDSEIGVTYYTNNFKLLGFEIIAQVWALNQDQRFNPLKPMYYKGAKLIIFVKLNNSSTVAQLIDYAEKAMIAYNQIILLENTNAFTEPLLKFAMILALYNDELISDGEFKDQELAYEKGNNPKFTLADSFLNPEL